MAQETVDTGKWVEHVLLDGVTGDTTSAAVDIDTARFHTFRVIVDVGTAANVVIQGRTISRTNWVPLNTAVTADGAISVDAMPIMRAVSTGVNGALTVVMRGDKGR